MGFHLSRYTEEVRADILGEAMFNGRIFSKANVSKVAAKVAREYTSQILTSAACLKSIDIGTSLNDRGVSQMAQIEKASGKFKFKRGKSMVHHRNQITKARKIANALVKLLFNVQINHSEEVKNAKFGDFVELEFERVFRFMIETYGLRQLAVSSGIWFCITGDGAEICNTTGANNTVVGLKAIDENSVDSSGEHIFFDLKLDDDGRQFKEYKVNQLFYVLLYCSRKLPLTVEILQGLPINSTLPSNWRSHAG